MIRTQIYLPVSLYKTLQLLAKRERKPTAQVIRERLEQGVAKQKISAGEGLLRIAELGKKLDVKGPVDLSVNHDYYLYEEPFAK